MISRDENVRCGWCGKASKLGEWNDLTYSKCVNREMKRAFTQLTSERAFLRKSDTFYMCPRCSKWSRGSQLSIVDTTDEKLMKLGREPVMGILSD
jgi:hypothetical protein